jgi:predicted dehydrogenase
MTPTRVAVVGSGYWGRNLVRVFSELGVLAAVCDTNAQALADVREAHPSVAVTSDYDQVLSDPRIGAVVVATPAEEHFSIASRALTAGKDTFVEKPLALTVDQGLQLAAMANGLGRVLMVGHILHYHPAVRALKTKVDAGELGDLYYIYSNRLNLGRVRTEENILWSFAPHDISAVLLLAGGQIRQVGVAGGAFLQPAIADVTVTTLTFDNGVRGHIFVSWLHPYKEHRLVLVGSRKMAVFDDLAGPRRLTIYDKRIAWAEGVPTPVHAPDDIVELPDVEPLRAECEHFLECVRLRRTPETDGRNGTRVLAVLEACQRSLERNGAAAEVVFPAEEPGYRGKSFLQT